MDLKTLRKELVFMNNRFLDERHLDSCFMTFLHFNMACEMMEGKCYMFSDCTKAKVISFLVSKERQLGKFDIYDVKFNGKDGMIEDTDDRIYKWNKTIHRFCMHREERVDDSIFPDIEPVEVIEF